MQTISVKITTKLNMEYYNVPKDTVKTISLYDYLCGVVASLIGNAPIEVCKAQAVASRTTAYHYYNYNKTISDSSSKVQAFRASRINGSYTNCYKAVKETLGELVCYNGTPCSPCSFSNSNGGRTVSSQQQWGGYRLWLLLKDDPYDTGTKTGHGVGMSQLGAKNMAKEGKPYKEILQFYYPGTTVQKRGVDKMLTTELTDKFVETALKIYKTHKVTYKNGYNGYKASDGTYWCDCRGYVIWTLNTMGIKMSSTGTNWMIRNQMHDVKRVSDKSLLKPGMVVFKSYEKGSDKWNLPTKYHRGKANYDAAFGEQDIYHVGIVIQTTPSLIIRHCSGGGIRTDTVLGKWCYAGYTQWVYPSAQTQNNEQVILEPQNNSTLRTVIGSGKVNLRKGAGRTYPRICYVSPGLKVSIIRKINDDWMLVTYGTNTGYMMTTFISKE